MLLNIMLVTIIATMIIIIKIKCTFCGALQRRQRLRQLRLQLGNLHALRGGQFTAAGGHFMYHME